ncbi:Txe/YoeB family addiction module toxin [Candidatus Thiothrix sp. Deng01]|uniref:Putative mRNA interferase YoeB n=1 Tax=Candidatus Thiothrix phosphatis TaxID=3112415 RepID=A0ABU6CVR2_9GAMM|nr:Txe/YoeB family addiction module toxin [Candidatus Thiothrix sp. Deng01]MEB4590936.1 Txe/YoeB family addiction module toxin [Candidatus Thiothrix sp. Deng01]
MRIIFSSKAWEDYVYWQQADRKILKRINELVKAIVRDPFDGIGKPEPLRHGLSGYWSRRINDEHRLVYKVEGEDLLIAMCRYHYA